MSTSKTTSKASEIEQARSEALRQVARYAPSKTTVFSRAFGSRSRSDAIKAKCLDCSDYSASEIRDCEAYSCPLRNVRPYQNSKWGNTGDVTTKMEDKAND